MVSKICGSSIKVFQSANCTIIIAVILCALTAVCGIMAFTAACQKYGINLENLQATKNALEGFLVGCDTIEGIAARKLSAPYSVLPTCSDVTSKIENVTTEIAELMKNAPRNMITAVTSSWSTATLLAGGICAGIYSIKSRGGLESKSQKYKNKYLKLRKITSSEQK